MNTPFNIKTGVRVPELDGLRGLAILLVVSYHYAFWTVQPGGGGFYKFVYDVFPLAWSGVDLFFVLSGFLIGGILMDQRQTENYFKTFYTRRACRVFPLYFLWLGLFVLFSGLALRSFHQEWVTSLFDRQGVPTWLYAVYLQNFHNARIGLSGSIWLGQTWSLAIEEQFYLIVPFLIWIIPPRRLLHTLVSLIILVPIFRLFMFLCHNGLFQYVLLPCRADSLLIGALCACMVRQGSSRDFLEKHRGWLLGALIVLFIGMVYLTVDAREIDPLSFESSFDMVFLGYSWIALFYACLLLMAVIAVNGTIARCMRFSLLRYVGIISYGVYMIHMAIFTIIHGLIFQGKPLLGNFSSGAVLILALLATMSVAVVSWHFFEKPIIRWGHSFTYAQKKADPVLSNTREGAGSHARGDRR